MRIRTATAIAPLLAAGLVPLTLPAPTHAVDAAAPYDFNGDGHRDPAFGAPGATVGGKAVLSIGGTGEKAGDGAIRWLRSATTSGAKSFGPAKFGISTTGTPSFRAPLHG